jgi:5-methylthioadenosine/S-adenosylhomocysteine deaminase
VSRLLLSGAAVMAMSPQRPDIEHVEILIDDDRIEAADRGLSRQAIVLPMR